MRSDREHIEFHRGRVHELLELIPKFQMGHEDFRRLADSVREMLQELQAYEAPIYERLRLDLVRLQERLEATITEQRIEERGDLLDP